ncbi:MAG TPA: cytochrome c biogenesis protein CcsA [Bacteriovoracaceae bacterium]|nr:cytochrome c biogenesis protein CcsA [Bacteriovoracaceae bacterium]
MLKYFFSILLLITSQAHAQMNFCTTELETYPVLAGGREKPLYVLATETLKFITGETKFGELSATEAFCKLSLTAFGMPLNLPISAKVDHVEVRKLLGMPEGSTTIPIEQLQEKIGVLETEHAQLKENNSYKKELNRVIQRLSTYKAITEARAWTAPMQKEGKITFVPLAEFLSQDRVAAVQDKGENPVKYLFNDAKETYVRANGDGYLLELKYFKWNLFMWAMLAAILAIVFLVLVKSKTPGTILTVLTIGIQITAMVMRVMISGRAPVTNMYETVMFSGFGALVISCIITLMRKEKAFLIAGLSYNVLSLMMMKFANGMLDAGISPLVPVLRDNFWLSTHVTTVILSYAALALSWMLANSILIRSRFSIVSSSEYRYQVDLIYTCIKFGVVLLSGGVILGGVWADYSWGRFWGWDPKETWSLIVLLVYIAILHGKYTSWIPPQRFVPLVAGAFMSVMMAWFGVNYILASGLHSYGFSEGGAVFLGTFFALQIAVLVLCTVRAKTV